MSQDKRERWGWFATHVDTVIVLATFITGFCWMNAKFNTLEKDVVVIKTVLIMKNIMPQDAAMLAVEKD